MSLMGASIFTLIFFVVTLNIAQWLIAPYLIGAMYGTREISRSANPKLSAMIERLSNRSGIAVPKLMIAKLPIPNAFAFGSPLSGNRVAVTEGLLERLEDEEVEAVVGHELGHLKHRDVQVMMFVSILPAIFYYIGWSLMWSSMFSGGRRRENGSGLAVLIGIAGMVFYWLLTLFTLYLSRLREYYADRHSATIVDDGARKLSEALAKISTSTSRIMRGESSALPSAGFKALLISDPDSAAADTVRITTVGGGSKDEALVREIMSRPISSFGRVMELFTTHPNIVKRLRALRSI